MNFMKVQYKDKTFNIDRPMKISEILKEEIENSEHTVIAATLDNEYRNLDYYVKHDCKTSLDLHQEPHKAHAHYIAHAVFPSHTALFAKENCKYSQQSAVPHRFVGTFHISAANCPPAF